MGFLGDIFGALTNQQSAPQQTIIPTQDLLNQTYGALQSTVPAIQSYNNALQPVLTGLQLNNEAQIYGSAAPQLRQNTYKSILDQLNLGTSLPADLQQQVIQNALQGSAASGFGVSPGGRGLVAKDLGLTGLDLLNQRQNAALQAENLLPASHYQYQPQGIMQPEAIAQDIRGVQAQQDNLANAQEQIRKSNFSNLLATGFRIAGGVAGAVFGGPAGAAAGMSLGNTLFPQAGGQGQQSSSPFGSILNLFKPSSIPATPANEGYTGDVNYNNFGNYA